MRILDLFAGIGGFSLAGHWAGHNTIAFVEKDPFCQQVLKKNFTGVPIYGDIKEFDGTKYNGTVDIICGGFPCQPFSVAGKRNGTDDDRHLWPEMLRIIREVKPTWVIGENVGGFLTIGEGLVFEQTCLDLEAEEYEVQAFVIPAVAVNAPHRRDRVWIIAHKQCERLERASGKKLQGDITRFIINNTTPSYSDIMRPQEQGDREQTDRVRQLDEIIPDTNTTRFQGGREAGNIRGSGENGKQRLGINYNPEWDANWIEVATELCRVDDGLPTRVDGFEQPNKLPRKIFRRKTGEYTPAKHRRERLKSLGNSIVPQVAYEIFKAINEATV